MDPISDRLDEKAAGQNGQVHKRLFIFCDGTRQDGVNANRPLTNVATLARCLNGVADDDYLQTVYYDNGVGSASSPIAKLIDGATGRDISTKIMNAYSFISHNYNFSDDLDEIFLVGFSRGAFAVQCLASFISQVGLFQKQHLYYLRGMLALWENQNFRRLGRNQRNIVRDKLHKYVTRFRNEGLLHQVKIKACAVWDTVSASAVPMPWPRPLSFVGKEIPKAVENAFQALALDEAKMKFEPCIWESKESADTYARQCWFLGSHTDVGGNNDAALGVVPLIWMIGQLHANTDASFNMLEVTKHLKHRFLDWNLSVNKFLGQFTETAVFSETSNPGRMTRPSWHWWLSGLRPRGYHLKSNHHHPDLKLVHFTVRFAMADGGSRCKALRKWKTTGQGDGTVRWQLRENVLFEDKLSDDRDCKEYEEYEMFAAWRDGEHPIEQTDRTAFAAHVRVLIQDQTEESEGSLNYVYDLLGRNFYFDGDQLAPDIMYSP
ncbi:hypothetical protein GGS23DRAFT_383539 [Durotheca rogersii]|uniref:uncharacterized protein n=1 Tax=Durotheca rogersii TaxID=419775 RepID=UPI00221F21B6|nr:uncharacterized protein GGS23DRAFT_383539 [Durotheca rogersii]KAI5866352.1 hypothetical protein GGS23DRAFT_383539 [Durotheca rogersii]